MDAHSGHRLDSKGLQNPNPTPLISGRAIGVQNDKPTSLMRDHTSFVGKPGLYVAFASISKFSDNAVECCL